MVYCMNKPINWLLHFLFNGVFTICLLKAIINLENLKNVLLLKQEGGVI